MSAFLIRRSAALCWLVLASCSTGADMRGDDGPDDVPDEPPDGVDDGNRPPGKRNEDASVDDLTDARVRDAMADASDARIRAEDASVVDAADGGIPAEVEDESVRCRVTLERVCRAQAVCELYEDGGQARCVEEAEREAHCRDGGVGPKQFGPCLRDIDTVECARWQWDTFSWQNFPESCAR
jgi:hypothetical protein